MNITDINDTEIEIPATEELMIEGIFNRQKELHEKYKHVELNNHLGLGLVQSKEFSLDDKDWQYLIKDFAWRVTEELTEALEAKLEDNKLHCMEEIIDALHFYTELLIICGYKPSDINLYSAIEAEYFNSTILYPTYNLGLACNLLKNKPWKNTHLITDQKRFKEFLLKGYSDLIYCAIDHDLESIAGVYLVYMKKNLVNKFRIDSNY